MWAWWAVNAGPRPGKISLAHRRVLILDELPEFDTRSLEVMRQPLEDYTVTVRGRVAHSPSPANFMLAAGMNLCPCGWYGDLLKEYSCSTALVLRYQKRISGLLLDRV
jgi:magnesium chelatase family protein